MTAMAKPPEVCDGDDPSTGTRSARQPRPSVMLSAIVERFGGGAPTRHRVRDLSTGGVRIDQAGDLQRGATILVTIGALQSIGATVVWIRDGSAGLQFARAINPDDAKAKAAVPARPVGAPADGAPTAGWTYDLKNPYTRPR